MGREEGDQEKEVQDAEETEGVWRGKVKEMGLVETERAQWMREREKRRKGDIAGGRRGDKEWVQR